MDTGVPGKSVIAAMAAYGLAVLAALTGCGGGLGHTVGPPRPASVTAGATSSASRGGTDTGGTAKCVTSAARANCGPYKDLSITGSDGRNTLVGQDVWNPVPGWAQTLYVNDPGNWRAVANMPAGNSSVVSYPDTGEEYDANPLTSYSSIYSSFTEDMHPTNGTSAEAAYDIWLNDWHDEVMIQHDMVNRALCPALATVSFGGSGGVPVRDWHLCEYSHEIIWQLAGPSVQSGTVNVLAMLTWLENHGYLSGKSSLTDIGYGFEVCSTGGKPEVFSVSRFTIRAA